MDTLPAGEYYMGDPCYVIDEDLWDKFCDVYFQGEGVFEFEGHQVFAVSTAYGDGSYTDNLGNEYGVDAGMIGLIPLALCVREKKDLVGEAAEHKFDTADRKAPKSARPKPNHFNGMGHLFVSESPIRVGFELDDDDKIIYANVRRIRT